MLPLLPLLPLLPFLSLEDGEPLVWRGRPSGLVRLVEGLSEETYSGTGWFACLVNWPTRKQEPADTPVAEERGESCKEAGRREREALRNGQNQAEGPRRISGSGLEGVWG